MSPVRAPQEHPAPAPKNPWPRWGWLLWAVWLIFLLIPAAYVWNRADASVGWRVLGLSLIVLFAAVYGVGVWWMVQPDAPSSRSLHLLLGFLIALTVGAIWVLGPNAVSFTPFLISLGSFTLPRPWHWLFALAIVLVAMAGLALTGNFWEWAFFPFILVAIGVGMTAARLLSDQADDFDTVQQGLAISQERERVARDVHDVLGHSLTVVSVKAALAERLIDADPQRAKAEVADIARLARESLGEIRATVGGLRAASLADELSRARDTLTTAGIDAEVPPDVEVVDPAYRSVLGWVLREAVTNVVRHSRAERCRIAVTSTALVVEDDGVGIENRRLGHGLRGLQERVTDVGGTFSVSTGSDGRGTRVEASWPR